MILLDALRSAAHCQQIIGNLDTPWKFASQIPCEQGHTFAHVFECIGDSRDALDTACPVLLLGNIVMLLDRKPPRPLYSNCCPCGQIRVWWQVNSLSPSVTLL